MSLRIIVKTTDIERWISDRNGTPARRHGSDKDLRVLFGDDNGGYEPMTVDELIEALRFHHLVMMVDQEPGKTFHKFVERG